MSDCTCVRGDDGQVKVPRSRCPQHGWVDTRTPARLTDEQMAYASLLIREHAEHCPDFWVSDDDFDTWYAAAVARAKREERERIADELEAWAETHRPTSPYTEGRRDAAYRAVDVALRGATR